MTLAATAFACAVVVSSATVAQSFPQFNGATQLSIRSLKRVNIESRGTIDQRFTPAELPLRFSRLQEIPEPLGVDPRIYMMRKQMAARGTYAPFDFSPEALPLVTTPAATVKFAGQGDASGLEPPDMAIAASSSFEMEGVNISFAVYSPTGVKQTGWPKKAVSFFGIPKPSPSGCATQAFVSDPRAFYDPVDHRFWASILEVEGAFGVNSCNYVSKVWFAVSSTSDPRGTWHVYNVNTDLVGDMRALDYTQFGFNHLGVFIGGNMFNNSGTAFVDSEDIWFSKATAEGGGSLSGFAAEGFTVGGVQLDTVQPVLTETNATLDPGVEFLVSSENLNFGSGQCLTGCNHVALFSIKNPLTSPVLSGVVFTTKNFSMPANADEPGCPQCIETLDTRISGQPVYSANRDNGVISYALETGVNNGSQTVPGILWGEVHPTLGSSGVTGATIYQQGYVKSSGDQANSFGATMASTDGSLWMVNDVMSSTLNPGIVFRVNRTTDALNTFEGRATLKSGAASYIGGRWGDYEAMGLDDNSNIWMSSQLTKSTGDWGTEIGSDH